MANSDTSNAIVDQPLGHYNKVGSISNTPDETVRTSVSDVVVRLMEEHDAEFVGRMEVQSFSSKYEHAVGKSRIDKVTIIRQDYYRDIDDKTNCRVLVAEYKNKRAGMLYSRFHGYRAPRGLSCCDLCGRLGCRGANGMLWLNCLECFGGVAQGECYVDAICVDEEFRGQGIGKILMERAEQEAKGIGCSKMTLHVAQSNRAISLYQREGYDISESVDGCCCLWCALGIRKLYMMTKVI
ncbi:unnamed protein product [Owenia fusiformis]|uniref:Uncharacterized protein n=1 Tax=Owenia fusiformis TaxID=6347 RepID=A0A8J1UN27_OWEFU|nr:unnamed protein product [Owenia fusiformis]